jgi:hypothetical protein
MAVQNVVFWDVIPQNLVKTPAFRGACCLHLQGEELTLLYRQVARNLVTQIHGTG